jgi:hypothetical protein
LTVSFKGPNCDLSVSRTDWQSNRMDRLPATALSSASHEESVRFYSRVCQAGRLQVTSRDWFVTRKFVGVFSAEETTCKSH